MQQQEEVYREALLQASRYVVRNDRLELRDAAGATTLVFARRPRHAMNPADLVGTEWVLQSHDGAALLPGSTITITFTVDEARGSAGCRSYANTYESEGDRIWFPSMRMLEHDCMKPRDVREQEQRYIGLLETVRLYRLDDDELRLETRDGRELVFTPAP